jgi:hypothetical protein
MITKYTLHVKEIEYNVSIVCTYLEPSFDDIRLLSLNNQLMNMKKEVVLTVRVDPEIKDIIDSIAKKGDRTVAWVTRSLITEALQARKLLKPKAKSKT